MQQEYEIPKEMRCLLNAGHGPPADDIYIVRHTPDIPRNPNSEADLHAYGNGNSACGYYGNGGQLIRAQGFASPPHHGVDSYLYGGGRYNIPGPIIYGQDVENALREKDNRIKRLDYELHLAYDKKNQIAQELTDLKKHFDQLNARYQVLENKRKSTSSETEAISPVNQDGDLINLIPAEEPDSRGEAGRRKDNDDDVEAMMKSVQCSEPSIEQGEGGGGGGRRKARDESDGEVLEQKKQVKSPSSSSSSASFEVVGSNSHVTSPARSPYSDERDDYKFEVLKREELERDLESVKSILKEQNSKIYDLTEKVEAEKEERMKQAAELRRQMEALRSEFCGQRFETRASEGPTSPDWPATVEQLRKVVSELEAANWKLSEQVQELMREKEELKMRQENLSDAARMHGPAFNETALELASENSVLKHQIEAYKEDFEVERKDREKLISQKDTLKQCYETLRSDLDAARQQVKKYENDIGLLRLDNSALRTRLQQVTDELSALRDHPNRKVASPSAPAFPFVPPAEVKPPPTQRNPSVYKLPPPQTAQPSNWECSACTFRNPAPRSFCEMCGTQRPIPSAQSSLQAVGGALATNGQTPAMHWNVPPTTTTPLLSNLRNYGDIETD